MAVKANFSAVMIGALFYVQQGACVHLSWTDSWHDKPTAKMTSNYQLLCNIQTHNAFNFSVPYLAVPKNMLYSNCLLSIFR